MKKFLLILVTSLLVFSCGESKDTTDLVNKVIKKKDCVKKVCVMQEIGKIDKENLNACIDGKDLKPKSDITDKATDKATDKLVDYSNCDKDKINKCLDYLDTVDCKKIDEKASICDINNICK